MGWDSNFSHFPTFAPSATATPPPKVIQKSLSSSWPCIYRPQHIRPPRLLAKIVNSKCNFVQNDNLSNPKIIKHQRSKMLFTGTPELQRYSIFFLNFLLRVDPNVSQSQGPGPHRAWLHCPRGGRGAKGPL